MHTARKISPGFVAAMFLLAAFLLLLFHTRPAFTRLQELRSAAAELEQNFPADNGNSGEAAGMQTISEVEQKGLELAIPGTLEQDKLILDLNRIAKSTDVSFNTLTFSKQSQGETPSVNIAAGFQGTSANIVRFLKKIEENPRKLVIVETGIARAETNSGLELVNLNLTLKAFYRNNGL